MNLDEYIAEINTEKKIIQIFKKKTSRTVFCRSPREYIPRTPIAGGGKGSLVSLCVLSDSSGTGILILAVLQDEANKSSYQEFWGLV